MRERKLIQEGDLVQIVYVAGPAIPARLMHAPQGCGDVWEFQREDNGQLFVLNPYSPELVRWDLLERGPLGGDK